MSDCVFLVADKAMKSACEGFLCREKYNLSLGTREFTFEVTAHPQCDPGVYNTSHSLLAAYKDRCDYAVVILDKAWNGSPERVKIEEKISKDLERSGWSPEQFEIIVIEPELEAWILQDNRHVEKELGFDRHKYSCSLRKWLESEKLWPADRMKAPDPKLAVEKALMLARKPVSSARMYRNIVSRVSITKCQDPALQKLIDALRRWFPTE